jgi:hypothetical protein
MLDYWNAFRTDPEIRQLAEAWVTAPRPDWTDADDLLYRWFHTAPEKALAVICAAARIAPPDLLSSLAAGPLEDWLCHHGESRLDCIKALAHAHPAFRELVGGVWQNQMSKVLYQKVRAIAAGRL